jgi:hypothetical protein
MSARVVVIDPGNNGALALLSDTLELHDLEEMARGDAVRRWPAQADLFARVRDDGRAEAALIAGLIREATR